MFILDDNEENRHSLCQTTAHASPGRHQPEVPYSAEGAEVVSGV